MKHRLVTLGWLGIQRAYLDMSIDEAIVRYRQDEPDACEQELDPQEFEFDDEFCVYSAWAKD